MKQQPRGSEESGAQAGRPAAREPQRPQLTTAPQSRGVNGTASGPQRDRLRVDPRAARAADRRRNRRPGRGSNRPEEPRRPGEAVATQAIWAGWSAARFGGERD